MLTACSASALAGCGGIAERGLSRYAPLAERVAAQADGCDAQTLLRALIRAVNAGEVPPERQETVLSLANAVATAPCPGEASEEQREFASALADALRGGEPLGVFEVLRQLWRGLFA